MNKKVQSTIWLDLLTYIILPLVFVSGVMGVISSLSHFQFNISFILMVLADILFLIFYAYTFYQTHCRKKEAVFLLRILFWVTAITTSFDFANTKSYNDGYNFILMFVVYFAFCYIVWIRTNEIYLVKRKGLFGKTDSLKTSHRCKKCKRLVPNGKECPHCEKEEEEVDKKVSKKEK